METNKPKRTRIVTKVGDIFEVKVDDNTKKYIQYIISDLTWLNSSVIRAFKKTYPLDAKPTMQEIIEDEVDFYAHCVLRWGIEDGFWIKIGKHPDVGQISHIVFRDTNDYGDHSIEISENWRIWHINDEDVTAVGKLPEKYYHAEIGLVFNPKRIVHRMQTGNYGFKHYPGY